MNAYTWDRANRLLSMGGISYEYDGLGNRVQQTANSIATKYLLDLQPGLAVVLEATDSNGTTRYIHGPRGLERQQQPNGDWVFTVQDGLGSVRGVVGGEWPDVEMPGTRMYAPYGVPFGAEGTVETAFGFTGEQTDANELVYLRARYLSPGLGVFASLDPIMAFNPYRYTEGNPVNLIDPSGMISENPGDGCNSPYISESDPCKLYLCNPHIYKTCRIEKGLSACPPCPDNWTNLGGQLCECYFNHPGYSFDAFLLHSVLHPENWNQCNSFFTGESAEDRCQSIREQARALGFGLRHPDTVGISTTSTDVDALIKLIEYAASLPGAVPLTVSDDLACALLGGSSVRGGATIFTALFPAVLNKDATAWDWFRDTGFHSDYRDGGNQINHFWAYVNTAAHGHRYLAAVGDYAHEQLAFPEFLAGEHGASIQDQRLAYLGIGLGLAIGEGLVPLEQMGTIFKNYLTSPYPSADPSDPDRWPTIVLCRAIYIDSYYYLGTTPQTDCSPDAATWHGPAPGTTIRE